MRDMSAAVMGIRDFGIIADADAEPLHGTGIGAETVTGRACVAVDPSEAILRFEPGDIMVTAGTCPAWNAILAHAGGVITEEGGPLSHAAVIARELGLPAIIGCAHALDPDPRRRHHRARPQSTGAVQGPHPRLRSQLGRRFRRWGDRPAPQEREPCPRPTKRNGPRAVLPAPARWS